MRGSTLAKETVSKKTRRCDGTALKLIVIAMQAMRDVQFTTAVGMLDRLLDGGRHSVEGVSAPSVGTMSGAVLEYGRLKHGEDGARQALHLAEISCIFVLIFNIKKIYL